jgi:hypothetical protein
MTAWKINLHKMLFMEGKRIDSSGTHDLPAIRTYDLTISGD